MESPERATAQTSGHDTRASRQAPALGRRRKLNIPAESQQSRPPQSSVAIIGTGLAGLTTSHLVQNDELKRYSVTLFEQVSSLRCSIDLSSPHLLTVAAPNRQTNSPSTERLSLSKTTGLMPSSVLTCPCAPAPEATM